MTTRLSRDEQILHLLSRCEIGDCWEWTGAKNKWGYGLIGRGTYGDGSPHRFIYRTLTQINITGVTLDHLCKNPPCCNPDHLEPVTQAENVRRGSSPTSLLHRSDTCRYGHSLEDAIPKGKYRRCRQCNRDRSRENYQRHKEKYAEKAREYRKGKK